MPVGKEEVVKKVLSQLVAGNTAVGPKCRLRQVATKTQEKLSEQKPTPNRISAGTSSD